MNKTIIALSCVLLATPALAQSVAEKTGLNAVTGAAPSTADFVKEAASSDMYEIQSSQLAQQHADGATKSFASEMIADHTKTSTEMKSMAPKLNMTPPTTMVSSDQTMLDNLQKLNGNDFTKRYHDQQVTAHKNAVSLFQRYAKGGDNADLKAWASSTLPTLQHHLDMAQNLDK